MSSLHQHKDLLKKFAMSSSMKAKKSTAQYQAHTYRIYPSEHQVKKLLEWESANRFLWNLANEERMQPWQRSKADREKVFNKERIHPETKFKCSFYTQSADLTKLRAEYQWLKTVPSIVQQALLKKLDMAWERWFKTSNVGAPKFKKKSNRFESFECLNSTRFSKTMNFNFQN